MVEPKGFGVTHWKARGRGIFMLYMAGGVCDDDEGWIGCLCCTAAVLS